MKNHLFSSNALKKILCKKSLDVVCIFAMSKIVTDSLSNQPVLRQLKGTGHTSSSPSLSGDMGLPVLTGGGGVEVAGACGRAMVEGAGER